MEKITKSGLYSDSSGQVVLVTQGLTSYTLVAQKQILFRLFVDLPTRVKTVVARIEFRPFLGSDEVETIVIPSDNLIVEPAYPHGPSIGIVFQGDAFPSPGNYEVTFYLWGNFPDLREIVKTQLVFSPAGRLRILIHNTVGTTGWGTKMEPDFGWLLEILDALQRLSAMFPIRDGLHFGLSDTEAGLCYAFGEDIDLFVIPEKAQKFEAIAREARQINSSGSSDHVDASVAFRPRDRFRPNADGEKAGGSACSLLAAASVVGGFWRGAEQTASVLAQEVGHLFGLVPGNSPHDDGGSHSRDRAVIDPYAFNFVLLKPYEVPSNSFIGDVMGIGWQQGRDMTLFSAFDWEHLRQHLPKFPGSSSLMANNKRLTKNQQNEVVNEFHKSFANEPKLYISDIGKALPPRKGYVWHWTSNGFQLMSGPSDKKSRSRLAPSVEGIRSWLKDLGVKDAFAPIGDRQIRLVRNPNAPQSLPETDIGGF